MRQLNYFCGCPYVEETNEPFYVVWNKCSFGNGKLWENKTFSDNDNTSLSIAKEILDCYEEAYVEIFPLYQETFIRPSINPASFAIILVPADTDTGTDFEKLGFHAINLEELGFYAIDANYGYISYRVPSIELDHKNSIKLLDDITSGKKPNFIVGGKEIKLEQIKQVEDKVVWKFGDIELEYTAEQVNLLKQYI